MGPWRRQDSAAGFGRKEETCRSRVQIPPGPLFFTETLERKPDTLAPDIGAVREPNDGMSLVCSVSFQESLNSFVEVSGDVENPIYPGSGNQFWIEMPRRRTAVRRTGRTARRGGRIGLPVVVAGLLVAFLAGFTSAALIFHQVTPSTPGVVWASENTYTASVHIAAVKSEGGGIITTLEVEVGPGYGRVLTDTHPLVGFDFQYADRTAVKVASRITGYALDDDGEGLKGADIIYTVKAQGTIYIEAIDGPSAGAATTVATVAAIEGSKVKENVVITGTINEDGTIGAVGGILDKATAASESGADLFLVPEGQSKVTVYREVVRQVGPWRWVTYEPVVIDLNEYAENAGWTMKIMEVSRIEEALDLMLE